MGAAWILGEPGQGRGEGSVTGPPGNRAVSIPEDLYVQVGAR